MLVTYPGMKPGSIRVDQLDREQEDDKVIKYPEIGESNLCTINESRKFCTQEGTCEIE